MTSSQGAAEAATESSPVSVRQPSVTLAMILVTQIQFLAMLSLVESTGTEDSLLSDFARSLRSGSLMFVGRCLCTSFWALFS